MNHHRAIQYPFSKRTAQPAQGRQAGLPFLKPSYRLSTALLALLAFPCSVQAATLEPSDGAFQDQFGWALGYSNNIAVIGAPWDNIARSDQGSAYVYRSVETATGTVTQNFKLTAGDAAASDELGSSVSVFGTSAIVGAAYDESNDRGSVYLYRNLDTATGPTVTQNAKLIASDPTSSANFGVATSLYENTALVGAYGATVNGNSSQGAVYLYRNLDTATGTVTQNAKLIASDGSESNWFGAYVSLYGTMGIVNAYNTSPAGSAYLYRNLDTATGTVTEDAKFANSDGAGFNGPLSMDGTNALLAAGPDTYLYRNLDTAGGPLQEAAKLSFSNETIYGATAIALSGTNAIVGDGYQENSMGAAYLYTGLDTVSGSVTENVKIIRSSREGNDYFGASAALEGDTFVIGAYFGGKSNGTYSGTAHTGSVASLTTLDAGNAARNISGISFISQQDWVIGKATSGNSVTLGEGDTADVRAGGKAVHVGQNAGSNSNLLTINGTLLANEVYIGSIDGNSGNMLQLNEGASFEIAVFRLAYGNTLSIEGDYSDFASLMLYLGASSLQVWDGGLWETVDEDNYEDLISRNYSAGYTAVEAVPEPSAWLLMVLGGIVLALLRRRRSFSSVAAA